MSFACRVICQYWTSLVTLCMALLLYGYRGVCVLIGDRVVAVSGCGVCGWSWRAAFSAGVAYIAESV